MRTRSQQGEAANRALAATATAATTAVGAATGVQTSAGGTNEHEASAGGTNERGWYERVQGGQTSTRQAWGGYKRAWGGTNVAEAVVGLCALCLSSPSLIPPYNHFYFIFPYYLNIFTYFYVHVIL
jgi:hypothetical protein